MLYFTYVVRPGEAPEGRGPRVEPFFNLLIAFNLRIGILLQCLGYIGFIVFMFMSGIIPNSLLTFLRAEADSIGSIPVILLQLCCGMFVTGNIFTMAFQSVTDDDGSIKQNRAYRAGTKFLQQGSAVGIFGWSLTLLSFWATNNYYEDKWMTEQMGENASHWLIFLAARFCDGFMLVLYGLAVLLLEGYHSEGTHQLFAWICSASYLLSALMEFLALGLFGRTYLFYLFDHAYTALLGLSLLSTLLWAIAFEPISHHHDVKLTQSAMRNEYYKSRNAMAYYGPAVVNSEGEIDIAAAAEQVQQSLNHPQ